MSTTSISTFSNLLSSIIGRKALSIKYEMSLSRKSVSGMSNLILKLVILFIFNPF